MKKLNKYFLTIAISIIAANSIAQESKYLVGGSIGFNYSSQYFLNGLSISGEPFRTVSVSASPLFGYQLREQNMLGFSIESIFTNTKYKSNLSFDTTITAHSKVTNYIISPFYRNYINSSLFIQGQVNIGISNISNSSSWPENNTYTQKHKIIGLSLGLGYGFWLGENIQVEPMIKYTLNRNNNIEGDSVDMLHSNIFVFVGLVYRF